MRLNSLRFAAASAAWSTRVPALLLALLLGGCHPAAPEAASASDDPVVEGNAVTLSAAAVTAGGIATQAAVPASAPSLVLPGRVVWNEDRTVRVSSPFSGRVVSIEVKPGDRVTAGQTLAWLSSADYGSAQADQRKAQAALALARKNAARSQDLFEHGVAAARDAEQAAADLAAAEAEAQRAEARLKLFGDHASGVDQRYRLASPIAGTVVEKALNPGQEVSADAGGAPLFVISDPTQLWVQLDEPEAGLAAIAPGQTIALSTPVYPGETFTAQLEQIGDYIDPQTRTLKLRGRIDNPDRRLKAEMFVSATLSLPAAATPGLRVPASAVFLHEDQQQLFVAEADRRFRLQRVKTAAGSEGTVTVVEGLKPNEAVVTAGNLFLLQLLQHAAKAGS